jgi:hypothetical protein
MNDRHFNHFYVAGFTYYDGVDVFDKLHIGTKVELKHEADNKFDNYAVAIYLGNSKIGYVPKNMNKELFKFLSLGHTNLFEAKINQVTPDAHPENQIGVIVKILKK